MRSDAGCRVTAVPGWFQRYRSFQIRRPSRRADLVDYQGNRDSVRYVIFRRGELVVQLERTPGMIPAVKLRKL